MTINVAEEYVDLGSEETPNEYIFHDRATTKELNTDPALPIPPCNLTEEEKAEMELFNITEGSLSSDQKRRLLALLKAKSNAFAQHDWDMGECKVGPHKIRHWGR